MTQKFICRGKKITAKEQRADLEGQRKAILARIEAIADDGDDAAQKAANAAVKESLQAKAKELDSRIETLAAQKDDAIVGRMQCGYDITKIIEAHPVDGQDYKAKCPACGCEFGFKRVHENEL